MASRKTTKRASRRGQKTQRSSGKAASHNRSRTAKGPTKLEKAAAAARKKALRAKAIAKSASRAAVRSKAKIARKHETSAKLTSHAPSKTRADSSKKDTKAARPTVATASSKDSKVGELMNSSKTKISANVAVVVKNEAIAATRPAGASPRPVTVARGEPAPQAARPIQAKAATPAPAVAAPPVGANKPTRPAVIERTPSAPAEAVSAPSPARPAAPRHGFKASEFVVYPAHGVGQIVAIEEQEVAGFRLELFVITFVKDKMTLRVPVGKSASVGMRKLSDPDLVKRSLDTLLGRARIKRTMWSRRAQEYEAKINSGDLIAIAEVVRDLYRSEAQPEQSYSERQLYEAALDRMAREVAAVQKLSEGEALKALEAQLQRGQRRGKSETAGPGEAGEGDVEEAA